MVWYSCPVITMQRGRERKCENCRRSRCNIFIDVSQIVRRTEAIFDREKNYFGLSKSKHHFVEKPDWFQWNIDLIPDHMESICGTRWWSLHSELVCSTRTKMLKTSMKEIGPLQHVTAMKISRPSWHHSLSDLIKFLWSFQMIPGLFRLPTLRTVPGELCNLQFSVNS